jgi:hypothetical protein
MGKSLAMSTMERSHKLAPVARAMRRKFGHFFQEGEKGEN